MTERDAHRLATVAVPSHYDLEMAPDLEAATFSGTVAVTLDVVEAASELVLHAVALTIDEVWLEGDGRRVAATPTLDPSTETLHLSLAEPLEPGPWTLRSRFGGRLDDSLVGFYRSTFLDADGHERTIACTQFQSTHARRAFPCWDEPAFKASFAIRLVVADGLLAVSNGQETAVEHLADGRRRVHFATTMVMSTYLVAFVVGPLEATEVIDVDGVALRVIAPPGKADLTPFALEVGAFALRFLTEWYDLPYPGDKLDLVALPDFAFGAMENLGCVTFRESALLVDEARATQAELQRVADVVAHEIAHMWFGDLVTMRWWNGIWLNEAFATFMEMMTTDAFRPDWQRWVDFGTARSAAFDTDSLSTTRPIEYEVVTAADAEAMFDVLTYEKGASVVRMLQQYLGEGTFQQGIREYLRTHQHASTETTDLWDALEAASGEPVRQMMDAWIYRPGHPVVRIERNGGGIVVTQERFAFAPDPAGDVAPIAPEVRTVPLVLRVGLGGAEQLHRVLLEGPRQELDLGARPDWVVGNHEGNGFMRIQLGDEDLAALAAVAPRACSPAERYGLLEDEWALLLAGRTTVARLIGLVRSLAADDDLSVWRRTTAVLAGLHRLATPEQRPAFEGWVRALVAPALQALGDQPSPGESDRRSTLRAVLFEALGRTGADDHRRRQARRWFDELGRNPQALDAELSDATIGVVAAGSDPEVHQELWRRADAARTVQDRLRHLGAAADSADPSLVLAACDRYLGDGVRTQDAPFLLRRALTNPHATAGVWELITHRWSDAVDRFPSSTLPRMVEGIRTIADPALAERVAEFLRAHPLPQGSTVVDQHLERMWVSVALGRRVPDELAVALR